MIKMILLNLNLVRVLSSKKNLGLIINLRFLDSFKYVLILTIDKIN